MVRNAARGKPSTAADVMVTVPTSVASISQQIPGFVPCAVFSSRLDHACVVPQSQSFFSHPISTPIRHLPKPLILTRLFGCHPRRRRRPCFCICRCSCLSFPSPPTESSFRPKRRTVSSSAAQWRNPCICLCFCLPLPLPSPLPFWLSSFAAGGGSASAFAVAFLVVILRRRRRICFCLHPSTPTAS